VAVLTQPDHDAVVAADQPGSVAREGARGRARCKEEEAGGRDASRMHGATPRYFDSACM
jgi:hypothetical protein